ncbi:uroporphyrinogen-III synthase [Altererythrobacter sp. KTW20L]|uniref:uroporphyrinogen-III synthase n=1 Tax=Altererythrobacter sp. KTW20L TaxID=2942210 RepID=UPI0020C076E1|nr:uroporphyrinogen-III synthase [Altererythrobacter sp. KTW20L]MCL6249647.1 uroporphyrinogen-III synthase [Altererythrobacter sp. KTW20L]
MSHAVPCDWSGPGPSTVDALLLGSGRAIALGGPELQKYREKPVYAVGRATGRMAQEAGFRVQAIGAGGLQQVVDAIDSRPLTLLRLAGSRQVEVEPPQGVTVVTHVVYAIEDLPMPAQMAVLLGGGALVLLHSAGAAEHLRAECGRLGIDLSQVRLAALGPRIAEAAGDGWGEVRWASSPSDAALLALAADMCH